MKLSAILTLVHLLSFTSVCSALDKVPTVNNTATPTDGVHVATLSRSWNTGDEEILFGSVDQVLIDSQGNFYLLDSRLNEIKVLSADGEYQRSLARKGDGPGEFRFGTDLIHLPDGDLGILQSMMGKVVRITTDGTPTGEPIGLFPLDQHGSAGFSNVSEGMYRGGVLVFLPSGMSRTGTSSEQHHSLVSFNSRGQTQVTYLHHTATMSMTRPRMLENERYFPSAGRWTLGPKGRLFVAADRDQYRVTVMDKQGRSELFFGRDFESRPRTAAEKSAFGAGIRMNNGNGPVHVEKVPAKLEPCIVSIDVLDDGSIWVLNSRGVHDQVEGVFRTYDLFDNQGVFRKQVTVRHPGNGLTDNMFILGDGRIVIATDNNGELEAICYQVQVERKSAE